RLAFNNSEDLYTINADGTDQVRLTNDVQNQQNPSWSPDGAKIAFALHTDSPNSVPAPGIFTINPDGTGLTRLTTGAHDDPVWSPDGTRISFTGPDDATIYSMKPDGTDQRLLIAGRHARWSPDGQR